MQTFGNIEEGNSFGTNCGCNILSIHTNIKNFYHKRINRTSDFELPDELNGRYILCEKENYQLHDSMLFFRIYYRKFIYH